MGYGTLGRWSRAFSDVYLQSQQNKHANFPAIFGIDPATGSTAGGDSIVITGRHFARVTSVMFGTTAAASYSVDSDGQITAVSPAGTAGDTTIVITAPAGSASSAYTYA